MQLGFRINPADLVACSFFSLLLQMYGISKDVINIVWPIWKSWNVVVYFFRILSYTNIFVNQGMKTYQLIL